MSNLSLPKPPIIGSSDTEWAQYWEKVWRYLVPERSTSGDAAATIPTGSSYHGVTALTAARILTLPPASDYLEALPLTIQDESAAAGTYTITLSASAGDTLVGLNTITSNNGRRVCIRAGTRKWYCF